MQKLPWLFRVEGARRTLTGPYALAFNLTAVGFSLFYLYTSGFGLTMVDLEAVRLGLKGLPPAEIPRERTPEPRLPVARFQVPTVLSGASRVNVVRTCAAAGDDSIAADRSNAAAGVRRPAGGTESVQVAAATKSP